MRLSTERLAKIRAHTQAATTREVLSHHDTVMAAIRARINGVFDHPALIEFGPLTTDTLADVKAMAGEEMTMEPGDMKLPVESGEERAIRDKLWKGLRRFVGRTNTVAVRDQIAAGTAKALADVLLLRARDDRGKKPGDEWLTKGEPVEVVGTAYNGRTGVIDGVYEHGFVVLLDEGNWPDEPAVRTEFTPEWLKPLRLKGQDATDRIRARAKALYPRTGPPGPDVVADIAAECYRHEKERK